MQEYGDSHPGLRIAAVTFADETTARRYAAEIPLRMPLLIDRDMNLYRGYFMRRAAVWQVWGPKTWWAYGREIIKGRLPRKSTGDILQQGGDILIDPAGIIRLHHVGQGPADRPALEKIIRIITGS